MCASTSFEFLGGSMTQQVANYLEFSSEDSEADRKKALGEVVEVGQDVWVKVSTCLTAARWYVPL
jgi:hypothetical protein